MRVRPAPEARRYEGWMAADFASGCDAVRSLAQGEALPDVVRLSDETETRVSFGLSGTSGLRRAPGRRISACAGAAEAAS